MSSPLDGLPQDLPPEVRAEMYRRVVAELWRRGDLRYKLDSTQLKIREALDAASVRKFFLLCSRRLGKSFTLVCLALETCLKNPGARVLYLAPWAKDAADIVTDLAEQILADCPSDLKPEYRIQAREMVFKNGSIIRFKGVNGERAESLRGGATALVVLDEAGSMDELKYVVSSVVMPMTMTVPNSRIIFATTPAITPGHDSAAIYEDLAGRGATVKFTLLDNPRVSDEVKAEFLREAGEDPARIPLILSGVVGPKTTTARREYYCEWCTDSSLAVLPEFTEEAQKELVRDSPRPSFFDAYVSMDPGMQDRTGILYGYWDFLRAKLVIEEESLLHGPSTQTIAREIAAKEFALWGERAPFRRVSDVEPRLILDLRERHGLSFIKAEKQDSLGAVNLVRTMIQNRELEINPRCKNLIRQMKNAVWNRKVSDFARQEEGHFDLVAALKYLCRTVVRTRNPYPEGHFIPRGPNIFNSPKGSSGNDRRKLGLLDDTPYGRRVAGLKGKSKKPRRAP